MSWLVPTLFGVAFGVALERSELTRKKRVVGVFRLTDLTMLKFLLSALGTGAFVVQAVLSLGLVSAVPVPPTLPVANLTGGVLFGAAMAAAGFCSGTIFAASASGRGGLVAGICGLLTGALVMDAGGGRLAARLRATGPRFEGTISDLAGVSAWLIVLVLATAAIFFAYVAERRRPVTEIGRTDQSDAWSASR
jgi:hypothetical protein